jgi:curved DNA-binding protein CbpA
MPEDSDWATIYEWLELLDHLTYYDLLRVRDGATDDELKRAFHDFAATFHPDANAGRSARERDALMEIFKRGTEAYMVLGDPALRAQYDGQLANRASRRPPPRITSIPPGRERERDEGSHKLEDAVRTPSARPFAKRAEELVEAGDFRQAKLQMVLARHMDPDNAELEAYMREIEARLARGD